MNDLLDTLRHEKDSLSNDIKVSQETLIILNTFRFYVVGVFNGRIVFVIFRPRKRHALLWSKPFAMLVIRVCVFSKKQLNRKMNFRQLREDIPHLKPRYVIQMVFLVPPK